MVDFVLFKGITSIHFIYESITINTAIAGYYLNFGK